MNQPEDKPREQDTTREEWGDATTPRMRATLKEYFDAPEWKLSKELFETGQQLERELAEAKDIIDGALGRTTADLDEALGEICSAHIVALDVAQRPSGPTPITDIDAIEEAFPLIGEFENDARYAWPSRWRAVRDDLKNAAQGDARICSISEVENPKTGKMQWCETHGYYFGLGQSCPSALAVSSTATLRCPCGNQANYCKDCADGDVRAALSAREPTWKRRAHYIAERAGNSDAVYFGINSTDAEFDAATDDICAANSKNPAD